MRSKRDKTKRKEELTLPLNSEVIVTSEHGLHARPASNIVQYLDNKSSLVTFTFNGQTINAKSILGILTLAAPQGSKILITVSGNDENEVISSLSSFFNNSFEGF